MVKLEIVGLPKNYEGFDPSMLTLNISLKDEDFMVGKHNVNVQVTGLEKLNLKSPLTVELNFSKIETSARSEL